MKKGDRIWLIAVLGLLILTAVISYIYAGLVKMEAGLERRRQNEEKQEAFNRVPQYRGSIGGHGEYRLIRPVGVYVDEVGNVYVSDAGRGRVEVFSASGEHMRSFTPPGRSSDSYLYGIVKRGDNILVADAGREVVFELGFSEKAREVVVKDKLGTVRPGAVVIDGKGQTILSDLKGHRVVILDEKNRVLKSLGKKAGEPGILQYPHGIAVDTQGRLWVTDAGNRRIQVFDARGKVKFTVDGTANGGRPFVALRGVAVDELGRVMAVDALAGVIRVFNLKGEEIFSFGRDLKFPMGIFVREGKIFIADTGNGRIQIWE
ncbi:hypothetical protein [Calderihabitans maritimus]|uniref:NHL repeat containing protein n=1 Tax=Calderihabitans maritimus TaxID=1246530 RepID=A0A1Z5HVM6_9FIRM|nr:hypothetical protein [Calderihabitans maritimus]GAW93599.1 NHL repeat containing protein [Calderihabitans maritimus]